MKGLLYKVGLIIQGYDDDDMIKLYLNTLTTSTKADFHQGRVRYRTKIGIK